MSEPQVALQMQSASVDAQDGTDPRDRALAVLRRERVLAALRDASATWRGEEAVSWCR